MTKVSKRAKPKQDHPAILPKYLELGQASISTSSTHPTTNQHLGAAPSLATTSSLHHNSITLNSPQSHTIFCQYTSCEYYSRRHFLIATDSLQILLQADVAFHNRRYFNSRKSLHVPIKTRTNIYNGRDSQTSCFPCGSHGYKTPRRWILLLHSRQKLLGRRGCISSG